MSGEPDGASGQPRVAVIIPCYRVAAHLADVIRSVPASCADIICVDDASPDDVAGALAALGDERVVCIRHDRNRGVGGAVKTGWTEAMARGADILVKLDGDGQMDGRDIDALIGPLVEGWADFAKGNRFVQYAALRAMPRTRLLGNAVLSLGTKAVSGYWNVLDPTNGFVAIRADVVRQLDVAWLADRYFFETSLLVELNIERARVADVALPARYGNAPSSLSVRHTLATFPPRLIGAMARRFYWRYLIQDFGVVSLGTLLGVPLVVFGVVFGAWHWIQSARTGVPATAGTVFVAALPIILGAQLLLAALVLDVISSPTVKRGRRMHDAPRVHR
ncbi:MAG TPA: glycosyltransferase family 2 protein [Gemmatimonadaceae bacterium]